MKTATWMSRMAWARPPAIYHMKIICYLLWYCHAWYACNAITQQLCGLISNSLVPNCKQRSLHLQSLHLLAGSDARALAVCICRRAAIHNRAVTQHVMTTRCATSLWAPGGPAWTTGHGATVWISLASPSHASLHQSWRAATPSRSAFATRLN